MTRDKRLPFAQWADIHRTDRFISIEPLSGYNMVQREDEGCVFYLLPDASDDALGRALLGALDKSRFIWPPDEAVEFFKEERYLECDRNWHKEIMRRYGYETKQELYKNMNWCRAERSEGTISIQSHKCDDKPEHGKWVPPDKTVIVPVTTNFAAAGAALRLALDRGE